MANAPYRPKLTPRMYRAYLAAKLAPLCRDKLGRWSPDGKPCVVTYGDTTIHALIVRGYLDVVHREKVSRKPIAVKAADLERRA